jgi:hypothetical protein
LIGHLIGHTANSPLKGTVPALPFGDTSWLNGRLKFLIFVIFLRDHSVWLSSRSERRQHRRVATWSLFSLGLWSVFRLWTISCAQKKKAATLRCGLLSLHCCREDCPGDSLYRRGRNLV